MSKKSLILGGVKSGKSRYAEAAAEALQIPVRVIVTATAEDTEMADRIKRHQQQRNPTWEVEESPIKLGDSVSAAPNDTCLIVDCLTLWLTNLLISEDESLFTEQRGAFLQAMESRQGNIIVVSNETNMGIIPMGKLSRRFCDEAGLLHQQLALMSDDVVLIIAGLPQRLKTSSTASRQI